MCKVAGYGPRDLGSIPNRGFSLSLPVSDQLHGTSIVLSSGYGGSFFPRRKSGQIMNLITSNIADDKNAWSFSFSPSIRLQGEVLNHRDT